VTAVLELTNADFEQEVLTGDELTLVYFWASWCGPCRLVSPSIKAIAQTYGERLKVVKLEIDPNPDAVAKCKVEGVPAIRLFKNKELLESHEGAIGKQQLQALLDNYL
jgi:thioredoxin 1